MIVFMLHTSLRAREVCTLTRTQVKLGKRSGSLHVCRKRCLGLRKEGAVIPPLRLSLLGDFLLISGETPVTTLTVPRVQSLLVYLVLHRSAPQDRSHLAFLLWPDSEEAQAHTNLRQLLYHLRQALPHADHLLYADRQASTGARPRR